MKTKNVNALERLVTRCNEMDITEQLNWLGDAVTPYQAKKELADLDAVAQWAAAWFRGLCSDRELAQVLAEPK